MAQPPMIMASSTIYHLRAGELGKLVVYFQSESRGLRARSVTKGVSLSQRQEKTNFPAKAIRYRDNFPFLHPFVLLRPSMD